MNNRSLVFTLLAGLCIILVIALLARHSQPESIPASSGIPDIPKSFISDPGHVSKASSPGWRRYESRAYGFSIDYPQSWNILDLTSDIQGSGNANLELHFQNNDEPFPSASDPFKSESYVDVQVTYEASGVTLADFAGDSKIVPIRLGGVSYDAALPFGNPFAPRTIATDRGYYAYVLHSGNLYIISYGSANESEFGKNKDLLVKIISSIAFAR